MRKTKIRIKSFMCLSLLAVIMPLSSMGQAYASPVGVPVTTVAMSQCGAGSGAVHTSINFGCMGAHCYPKNDGNAYCGSYHNAIVDLLFAVIRFLTDGIGLIIIASLIIAGIQYTTSQGDPSAINHATERIRSSATALALFIFAYAILNYIVPNGFFGQ